MIFSEEELAAMQAHSDVVELAEELHKKAGGANWNGLGYVRELRILATSIAAICGARMCELEFENARVDNKRRSGVNLEAQRTGKKSGLEQRTTNSGSLRRRDIPARHHSRKKVGTVGRR